MKNEIIEEIEIRVLDVMNNIDNILIHMIYLKNLEGKCIENNTFDEIVTELNDNIIFKKFIDKWDKLENFVEGY